MEETNEKQLDDDSTKHNEENEGKGNQNTASMKSFVIILGIIAAGFLIFSGFQMIGIHSVASQAGSSTIAEAFYHALGWGFIGIGLLGCGLSVGIGLKL